MQTDPVASRLREARAAFERGDWPEAREIYDSLVEEDPENPEVLAGLGETMWFMCEIAEGKALLDEGAAAAMGGELRSPRQIGSTCCSVLSACDQTSDFERAVQWCRRMIDLTERLRYTPLLPWCRAIYAGTLIQAGDWERAEEELQASLRA